MAGHIQSSKSVHWNTPQWVVYVCKTVWDGVIELDPCSNPSSIVGARTSYILENGNDGLVDSWAYTSVYVNPPYGRDTERGTSIYNWIERCTLANALHGSSVIALIPAAVDTKHWQDLIFRTASAVLFIKGRMRFLIDGKPSAKPAPMACALVYWGHAPAHFAAACYGKGKIIYPTRNL